MWTGRYVAPVNITANTVVPVLDMCLSYGTEAPMEDAGMPLMTMHVRTLAPFAQQSVRCKRGPAYTLTIRQLSTFA